MVKNKRILFAALAFGGVVALAAGFLFSPTAFAVGPNLIVNPSMETAGTGGMPSGWSEGGWGTNTTVFKYPVAGVNGGVGANVAMTTYTSGDAKWYFANVAVAAKTAYTLSDNYSSTIASQLVAQYTSTSNALSYVTLATLPSTNGTWATSTVNFMVPASIKAMTVFHLIAGVGSLTTDNYFLGTTANTTSSPTSTPAAPLTILPATLPNGTTTIPYSQVLTASTTATGTFTWSISSGALPAGLKLGTSQTTANSISGTPTKAAASTFTVRATNGLSSSTRSYAINIGQAVATSTPPAPTSTLAVNLTINGGSSTPPNFNLSVKSGTTSLFNGAAANTQSFTLNVGASYAVTEATTTASTDYTITLGSNCSGKVASTSSIACAITNTFVPASTSTNPTSTGNLIVNPSLTNDTVTPGSPDSWNQGGWGTNTAAFNYPVAGVNGGTGANITISSFTNGDAKWYFNNVFVTPGANYTFSDSYNSNIPSTLVAQFTSNGGAVTYSDIATLNATNGAWTTTTQTITAPANAAAVTIFHLIAGVGSLTTTNYSLTPATGPSELFPRGLVSMTFDDGWESQYDNALPILQAASMPGTFYIITDGMLNAEETTFPSSDNPFNVATTTKSATWSQIYTDPTQHNFVFSDTYTATGPSTLTVKYNIAGGGGASSTVLGPFAAGTNVNTTSTFTLPAITGPLTIIQSVGGSDTITVTNPLLTQPVGYMDTGHVLYLQQAGEEIGDHTVNHCDLGAVYTTGATSSCAVMPPASTTVQFQVDQARTDLQNAGFSPVDTFAYPYGGGASNQNVEAIIKADGIISARSVNAGYNTKSTDDYSLLTQSVDTTVPDFATVQQWIDYAAANKVWLILTFHQIELSSTTITQNKETDATTAAMLQQIVSYLASQRAAGKIDVDTVHNIMTQFVQ